MHIQKIIGMFYTNVTLSKKQIIKIPLMLVSKKNEIHSNKFNQEDNNIQSLKIIKYWRKNFKKTQINWKIFYVHVLEELIGLKCQYYPMWYEGQIQTLSHLQTVYLIKSW